MSGEAFIDTNVILYLISPDAEKADRAEHLIAKGGTTSVQVLNEFTAVCLRKALLEIEEIQEFLLTIRALLKVVPIDLPTHERAVEIAAIHNYSFYDCLIIAAAGLAFCTNLYSEDMSDGHIIDGLVIVNPFRT